MVSFITNEDSNIKITLNDLNNYCLSGNYVSSPVDAFIIEGISIDTYTLKLGLTEELAEAFDLSYNEIDASNNAYWTPSINYIGSTYTFSVHTLSNPLNKILIPIDVISIYGEVTKNLYNQMIVYGKLNNVTNALSWKFSNNSQSKAGIYGTITILDNSGNWKYELNNNSFIVQSIADGDQYSELFKVTNNDGLNANTSQQITIIVKGEKISLSVPIITYHIINDNQITIFFRFNQDIGLPFIEYEYSINNNKWIIFIPNIIDIKNKSVTIYGLQKRIQYSIRLRTRSQNISSSDSIVLSFIPSLHINTYNTNNTNTNSTNIEHINSFGLRMLTTTNKFSSNNHLSCQQVTYYQIEQPRIDPFTILYGSPSIIFENDYYYITFIDNGMIDFILPISADVNDFHVLVVGGGGGGGDCTPSPDFNSGGGGGAGGAVKLQNMSVSRAIYNITIGQGGQAVTPTQPFSTNGSNSIFSTVVASGGLKGSDATNIGGQGGIGNNGGGSGGNGGTKSSSVQATNGSNGTSTVINLITTYYGGGGGGGSYRFQPSSSVGGLGGGGGGGFNFRDGLPNTGGGGAGRNGDGFGNNNGGQGGSGIVIIYFKYIPTFKTIYTSPVNKCVQDINKKVANSSGDVDQTLTQSQRAVNAINYSTGGRTIFGIYGTNSNRLNFLGRTEGQPGGIMGPLRNKF
jgi:VCBS repeat-containing protein